MSMITSPRVGFGLVYGFQPFDAGRMTEEARQAEALGFDLCWGPVTTS